MQKLDMSITQYDDFRSNEAYKVVRTNIMFSGIQTKAIAFTSTTENEGKSTVTWNLAISFAQSGKKVLFIDGDMRKSVFAGRNRIYNRTEGLSHYLSGQSTLDEILYSTDIDNLFVILPGVFPPNPAELLSTPIFSKLIENLKEVFDYILIDTPPVISAIDPAIIASVCDASILVVGFNGNSCKLINLAMEQLEKTSKPILGAILNKFKFSSNGLYDKYYYKYYGKKDIGINARRKAANNFKWRLDAVLAVLMLIIGAAAFFSVKSRDSAPPVITFTQDPVYYRGDDLSVLLTGVSATDNEDGDVSSNIVVDRVVENPDGTLSVSYAAKDSSNNVAKLSRSVAIHEIIVPDETKDKNKTK